MEATENKKYFHGWRLSRCEIKAQKNLLRATGDAGAAEKLLRHSIAYGHNRLVVRRYLLAHALGSTDLEIYASHFMAAMKQLTSTEVEKAREDVRRRASLLLTRNRALAMDAAASVAG
jgi:hypothetical protein